MKECICPQLKELFSQYHAKAVEIHLRYSVSAGERNQKAFLEYEKAIRHIANCFLDSGESLEKELQYARGHFMRIIYELQEILCEDYLYRIRSRIDPTFRKKWLCKLLIIKPPRNADEIMERLKKGQNLLENARYLKGQHGRQEECMKSFDELYTFIDKLDRETPNSMVYQQIFTLCVALGSVFLGYLLGKF